MNTNEIESVRNYLQSIDDKFEFYLKGTLPEPSPESSLIKEPRGNRLFCIFKKYFVLPLVDVWLAYNWKSAIPVQLGPIIPVQYAATRDLIGMFLSKSLSPHIFLFILHQCLSLSFCYAFRCRVINTIDAIEFLAVITKVNPGSSLDKWDEIARYMREYLINKQTSSTSVKFSDGKHCMKFYKTCLQPPSSKKDQGAYYELKRVREIALQHLD